MEPHQSGKFFSESLFKPCTMISIGPLLPRSPADRESPLQAGVMFFWRRCQRETQSIKLEIACEVKACHERHPLLKMHVRRLCQPMVDYFTGKGGSFRYNARLQKIQLGSDGKVEGFQLSDGSTVTGDLYLSAMPGELAFPWRQCWLSCLGRCEAALSGVSMTCSTSNSVATLLSIDAPLPNQAQRKTAAFAAENRAIRACQLASLVACQERCVCA